MRRTRTIIGWSVALLALAAGLVYAFLPQPVAVDLAVVDRGPMMATVDEEGRTRVKEVYLVSAPLPGRVLRVSAKVGDAVVAGETVLAEIRPAQPAFLDSRTRAERLAAVKAAEAARAHAEAEVARIEAARDFARSELGRAESLARDGTVSQAALDRARMEARSQEAALRMTRAALGQRAYELETAQAAVLDPTDAGAAASGCCVTVRAPVSGRILRVLLESEQVAEAGTPLVEIGDPVDLEVVVELLSTEAVRVSPGDAVLIERWGGPDALPGRVARVEPFGFTKVSALGVEEQRVGVVVDFTGPPAERARLGHGYRVETRIVLWQAEQALRVPMGALFREADGWRVFAVAEGTARRRAVEIGHLNDRYGEVTAGLAAGETVILHPGERVADGVAVAPRDE